MKVLQRARVLSALLSNRRADLRSLALITPCEGRGARRRILITVTVHTLPITTTHAYSERTRRSHERSEAGLASRFDEAVATAHVSALARRTQSGVRRHRKLPSHGIGPCWQRMSSTPTWAE